jgi:hypothetical protein
MKRLSAVAIVVAFVAGLLTLQAGPAFACSCQAGVRVADALAGADGAFVGVLTGQDDPLGHGPLVSSGRPVVNHFEVERVVKGDIGARVDVEAAASGVSCGLELEVGERVGLLLLRTATGWRSSLCSQAAPAELLGLAPAGAAGGPVGGSESSGRAFVLAAGVLALAVAAYFVVPRFRRREA